MLRNLYKLACDQLWRQETQVEQVIGQSMEHTHKLVCWHGELAFWHDLEQFLLCKAIDIGVRFYQLCPEFFVRQGILLEDADHTAVLTMQEVFLKKLIERVRPVANDPEANDQMVQRNSII